MKPYNFLFIVLLFASNLLVANTQKNDEKLDNEVLTSIDMATTNANTSVSENSVVLDVEPSGVEVLKNVSFGILLGIFSYPLPMESEYCKKIRDILIVTQTDMGYIYSIGVFNNYQHAETYRRELVEQGYENADIISFYKNMPLLANTKQ